MPYSWVLRSAYYGSPLLYAMPKINVPTKNVSPQCAPDKLQVDDSETSGIANFIHKCMNMCLSPIFMFSTPLQVKHLFDINLFY